MRRAQAAWWPCAAVAAVVADQQQQDRRGRRQQHRQDRQVGVDPVHPGSAASGLPSTWSVPPSCRLRSASSMTKPVVAKPMTMAVSTSACGSGSASSGLRAEDRRRCAPQPAHAEDEDVDRVADQRQPQHHREAAPAQQQVDADGDDPADAGGNEQLHAHVCRSSASTSADPRGDCGPAWERPGARPAATDTGMRALRPFLAGRAQHRQHQHRRADHGDVHAQVEQRGGGQRQFAQHRHRRVAMRAGQEGPAEEEGTHAGQPGDAQADADPAREAPAAAPCSRFSARTWPSAMYCSTSAAAVTSPAMKPPPGRLWPRQ